MFYLIDVCALIIRSVVILEVLYEIALNPIFDCQPWQAAISFFEYPCVMCTAFKVTNFIILVKQMDLYALWTCYFLNDIIRSLSLIINYSFRNIFLRYDINFSW